MNFHRVVKDNLALIINSNHSTLIQMRVSQKVFLDTPDQVYIRRVMQRSKMFDGFVDALIYAITFNVIKKISDKSESKFANIAKGASLIDSKRRKITS